MAGALSFKEVFSPCANDKEKLTVYIQLCMANEEHIGAQLN